MKKLLLILLCLHFINQADGQVFKKYQIGESGCSAYFYCDPGVFDVSYSQDSAKIYTGECVAADETSYAVICVQLAQSGLDITNAEDLLLKYLDYLKSAFKIKSAVGYGKGHRLRGKENIHGIIDYWKDEKENNLKVKGWTDGNYIVVLYGYSKKELPEEKINLFLDGLVMKGM